MRFASGLAALLSLAFVPASFGAIQTMTFNGSGFGSASYTEAGFTLQATIPGNHWNDQGGATVLDYHSGSANTAINELVITSAGGAFDFLAFDVVANPDGVVFTSDLGHIFTVAQGVTGSFTLATPFQNITTLTIGYVDEVSNTYYQELDNLQFNDVATAATPEPTALAIWGLGALGCAFAYRRRKLKAVSAA